MRWRGRWPPVASRNYPGSFRAGFYLLIDHSLRETRPDETRRNDRHAQLIACLLAQTFGDVAHGEFRAGIDRHVWLNEMSRCRGGVDEMSETLLAKDGQRCRDAVKNALAVDVDHLLPILDAQVIQG